MCALALCGLCFLSSLFFPLAPPGRQKSTHIKLPLCDAFFFGMHSSPCHPHTSLPVLRHISGALWEAFPGFLHAELEFIFSLLFLLLITIITLISCLFDSFFDSCPHHILSICGQDLVPPSAVLPHTPRACSITLRFELKGITLKKSVKESPAAISDADRSVVGFLFLATENEPNVNNFPGECLGVNFEQRKRIWGIEAAATQEHY